MYNRCLRLCFAVIAVGVLLLAGMPASAQHEEHQSKKEADHAVIKKHLRDASKAAAEVKDLNEPFKGQRKVKGPLTAADNDVINEMKRHARDRSRAMEELIASDPEMALQTAFTPEERSQLPAAVQAELESEVELEGEVEVLIEDNFEEGTAKTHHTIIAGNERYSLHFAGPSPELISGSKVKVRGLKAGKRIAVPHQ